MGFDLIGDIHGEAPSLTALLSELGYRQTSNGFAHEGNRKAIFVGDLVDRVGSLVPVVAGVDVFYKFLGEHGIQYLLKGLPREICLVHDPGRLDRSPLYGPQNVEI